MTALDEMVNVVSRLRSILDGGEVLTEKWAETYWSIPPELLRVGIETLRGTGYPLAEEETVDGCGDTLHVYWRDRAHRPL